MQHKKYTNGDVMAVLYKGDCLDVLPKLDKASVDAVITDPPYGKTVCEWDVVIPFEDMWRCIDHVKKDKTSIVLFASQPFTSALVMSRVECFRYEWVWYKNCPSGFLNVHIRPMLNHESVVVFCTDGHPLYMPQGIIECNRRVRHGSPSKIYGSHRLDTYQEYTNYPRTIINFNVVPNGNGKLHPTQKPVPLIEYLIKTYTNEGDTVLDFTMGSGSTGVACMNTGRNFVGVELDDNYFDIACDRVQKATQQLRMFY